MLAQSSKAGAVPKDYAAIVGDSYSEGLGDWFCAADPRRNEAFASQHVLRALTGQDVVSWGQSGDGSLGGMAGTPIALFEQLSALGAGLAPPKRLLVYFYEGNDLDDNLRDLKARYYPRWDARRLRDPDYFAGFIRREAVEHGPLGLEASSLRWRDRLFLARMAANMLAALRGRYEQPPLSCPKAPPSGKINRLTIGGLAAPVPDDLQGPSLELTAAETQTGLYVFEQSLRFLSRYFPESRVTVVYVPSPLTCYRLASKRVSVQSYWNRAQVFAAARALARGEELAAKIAAAAKRQGADFLDPRPALREAAAREPIHGPRDWKHFNRRGYTVLAEAVAARLAAP